MSKYDAMSLDELRIEFVGLAQQLVPIETARREIAVLMEKRQAEAQAALRVAGMSGTQKDAMLNALAEDAGTTAQAVLESAKAAP